MSNYRLTMKGGRWRVQEKVWWGWKTLGSFYIESVAEDALRTLRKHEEKDTPEGKPRVQLLNWFSEVSSIPSTDETASEEKLQQEVKEETKK